MRLLNRCKGIVNPCMWDVNPCAMIRCMTTENVPLAFVRERERKHKEALKRLHAYRRRMSSGETVRQIAESEGITRQAVYKVLRRGLSSE